MEKYKVVINYTVAYCLAVVADAENEEEAKQKVRDEWYSNDDSLRREVTESSDYSELDIEVDSEISEEESKGYINI